MLPDEDAAIGHDDNVVLFLDLFDCHHPAGLLGRLDCEDPLPAPVADPVFVGFAALAEPFFCCNQNSRSGPPENDGTDNAVVFLGKPHRPHSSCSPAHDADFLFMEPDGHSLRRADDHVLLPVREMHIDQPVSLVEPDGHDARLAWIAELTEQRLLDIPLLRRHQNVQRRLEVFDSHIRDNPFFLFLGDKVGDGLSAACFAPFRNLKHLQPVASAFIGKEQYVLMRRCDEHRLDEVVLFGRRTAASASSPGLPSVTADRGPFDKAIMADCDHHLFFGDHVLDAELLGLVHDLRPAFISVLLSHLQEFFADDLHLQLLAFQDCPEAFDQLDGLAVLLFDLLPFQSGQALQAHVQDGLCLEFGELELLHQTVLRGLHIARRLDELDDRIDVVQSDDESFQDMRALLRLIQLELRASHHHGIAMGNEVLHDLLQREDLRPAVHQRQHDHAKGCLQLRVLVQIVQDHFRIRVTAEVDDDAQTVAVRFVPDVGDVLEFFLVDHVRDLFDQVRLVHLIRNLRDNNALPVVLSGFDGCAGAHHDASASGGVCAFDPFVAVDDAARRKIRRLHELHQALVVQTIVLDQRDAPVDDFSDVVRGDVGGHADGDSARAVDQQVRHHGRQHQWFAQRVIKIRSKIDGVLVEVPEHLLRKAFEAGFGVPHGRRRVAIH